MFCCDNSFIVASTAYGTRLYCQRGRLTDFMAMVHSFFIRLARYFNSAGYGISLIVGFLTYQSADNKQGKYNDDWPILYLNALLILVGRPAFVLLIGYIVHLFI